jgi:hypothetical protein
MRQQDRATDIAIAAPLPYGLRANFVDTTRSMIASAPGPSTDVTYSLVFWALLLFDAGRVGVDRFIATKVPAWRRIRQPRSRGG